MYRGDQTFWRKRGAGGKLCINVYFEGKLKIYILKRFFTIDYVTIRLRRYFMRIFLKKILS